MIGRKTLSLALALAAACSTQPTPTTNTTRGTPALDEHARTIEAMRPPKRSRPVIAVVADNDGTETTDFVVPYAVLAASGAADVFAVAPEARPIKLTPALAVLPHLTIAQFQMLYPEGADYLIVPKIDNTADGAVVSWIRAESARNSMIVGICSGVKTVGAAGLLDNRLSTGHWFDLDGLEKAHPTMRWVPDRRYVVDGNVVTTTGVSASLPISLALVEAIAGRERATQLAAELGVDTWDEQHQSTAFFLDDASKRVAETNRASKEKELYALRVAPGVDDIALSFTADSWSRTFRSKAIAIASERTIRTKYGLELVPDAKAMLPGAVELPALETARPADSLPNTLRRISERYGVDTAKFIALQLEYRWK